MDTPEEILKKIDKLVEQSAEKFNSKVPGIQDRVWSEVQALLKGLDLKGDKIVASVKNLKLVGSVGRKLLKIIIDKQYKSDVKEYLKAFNEITDLQNQYFMLLEQNFKQTPLLKAIRMEAINSTLEGLTEAGLSGITGNIKKTLQQNVTTGGSYKELMKTMSGQLTNTSSGEGVLARNVKTYTITSVAQYSRNYSQTVSEGLNIDWYQYVGSTITTTRCFCHAMVKKRYFHRSEIPDLLAGNFKQFEERDCELNRKTDLPDGMIKGTNVSNFLTYAGGWNCQHSIFPVPESWVPKELVKKFSDAS